MISLADIEAAASRIARHAVRTPLIESPALNDKLGMRVLIKPETLQRVGAFKFRGAYNRLVQLTPDQARTGVVAFSSGNHAQGVALAAQMLGMPALIVMPSDAPTIKIEATRGYGAEIQFYDRMSQDRVAMANQAALERGAVVVPAFDDNDIIAGQGTVGLELVQEVQARGLALVAFIAPVGGGGLLAGCATAIKALSPKTAIIGVEPAGYDDTLRSLQAGKKQSVSPGFRTLCDALESPSPGDLTLPILQATVADIAVVTDAEVALAMRYAYTTLKLVVEPGGAVGLAALLAGKVPLARPGATVGLVLSGGTVDPGLFARVLASEV